MRIAFVEHKLSLQTGGGSNMTLHSLASGLCALGHDVTVITVSPAMNSLLPDLPYRVVEDRLSDTYLGLRQRIVLARRLKRLDDSADLLHIEGPSLIASAGLYKRLGGRLPVVARLHNYGFFCTNVARMDSDCYRHCSLLDRLRHRPQPLANKLLLAPARIAEHYASLALVNRVDRFLAPSPAVAEIHSWYGVDPKKMVVMPSPLDYAKLAGMQREVDVSARDGQPFRILFAGRLTREKGVDILLRALAGLDFPFALDIAGEGPERAALEAMSDRLGLSASVSFRGWVPQGEIAQYYLRAQLFVHPVRWPEPSGRSITDALAFGLPLVVAGLGGPPWIAGEACRTFTPEDPDDLRAAIAAVYRDPALAQRLSAAGRERGREFDSARILETLIGVYDELVPAAVRGPERSAGAKSGAGPASGRRARRRPAGSAPSPERVQAQKRDDQP